MPKKLLFILIYFLSPIIPVIVVYGSNPDKYSAVSFAVEMILGVTAYTWLTFEFILIARPKFAERYFGMDSFFRFHGLMAVISLILAFLHTAAVEDLVRVKSICGIGGVAFDIFGLIIVLSLLLMVDSIILKIKPILWIRKFIEKLRIFKYEHYVAVHNLTVIALVLLLVHVILTSSARANLAVRLVYIIYFAIGAAFYIYHKVVKRIILNKNKFVVDEVIKESANMWTLKLVPENGEVFQYKPGQFGFLRLTDSKVKQEEHPFSMSSDPSDKSFLSITIKELGDFTSGIRNVQSGDTALLDAPYGKFSYLEHPDENETVLIAGGVGITPVLSMLRYMHSQDIGRNVMLIWGVNNRNDLIYEKEFEQIQRDMKSFLYIPVMFSDDSWEGEKGIINRDKLQKIFEKHGQDIQAKGYYVCGPAVMMNSVIPSLKALGVKRKRIHFEKFSI